jgi:hypothetical protein
MMEREDEEGPDEGQWRCLNAFWAVGRRVAVFWGVLYWVQKWKTEKRMKKMGAGGRPGESSSGRTKCLRLFHGCWSVITGVGVRE